MWAVSRPVRPIIQAFQSVAFVARQPTVHRPPRDAPIPGHLAHRPTVADYRQDRPVPLLSHAHLPHARERDKSAEVAVTHQPKVCDPSAEGLLGHVSRTCTTQVVPARGFEPRTLGLKDRCSNQAELRRLETIVPNFRIPPVLSHLPML